MSQQSSFIRNFMPPGNMRAVHGAARGEAAYAVLVAPAAVTQWSTSRRTGERRSLHRIVRAAHCRHCNSADCLQYENCVNAEFNWLSTQRQPKQLIDHDYSSNWSIDEESIDCYNLHTQPQLTQQPSKKQLQQPHTGTHTTLTQPTTVSLTGPRQPPPLNTIAQPPLRESTHSDTAEYSKKDSPSTAHRQIRMVWPADSALYDWSPSDSQQWDGQPIPIDDLDHVFDPLNYSTPHSLPHPPNQQQHYPTPEQTQVWSREEQATMDRLIEDAIGDDAVFEGFDLDELDNLLGEAEAPVEDEPLAEFFPMLGSSTSSGLTHGDLAPGSSSGSVTPPALSYHDMAAVPSTMTATPFDDFHHPSTSMYAAQQTTTTMTSVYAQSGGEWLKMGAPDGRIDRSPTFMDTGCDLNVYLNDWYDEPCTSRSSPDYDAAPLQQQYDQQLQLQPVQHAVAATRTTTTRSVRYAPYTRQPVAPAKRQPVFRPEGFGTPAIGENVDEYRKRRDKNNISSARSRAKKAEVLKEMKAEAVQLEKKNIELKAVLDSLEREVSYYKELMMTALSK